jgi:hypothetical protein
VYALGALLYECLTGRPPFDGPQHVVLVSVLNDEPLPLSRFGAKVPADLETICLKCLSKEPARRYASAEELANDLRRFQAGEPIRARPVGVVEWGWKWLRRNPVVAGLLSVLALVLITSLLVFGQLWQRAEKERSRLQAAFGRIQARVTQARQDLLEWEGRVQQQEMNIQTQQALVAKAKSVVAEDEQAGQAVPPIERQLHDRQVLVEEANLRQHEALLNALRQEANKQQKLLEIYQDLLKEEEP